MNHENIIKTWKKKKYNGDTIYLKPMEADDIQFMVAMRNQERSRYYLNQAEDSTVEAQTNWFKSYVSKNDDIYWVYCDKETDQKLGTIRLYNIEDEECEIGSSTADLSVKDSYFSFMEAHSVAMRFALEELKMPMLHADVRVDNKFVDAVLRRIGFEFKKVIDIRGVDYNYYKFYSNEKEG